MLKKIKAKPDHVKKKISLALTIVIFSWIVFVWLSSWDARTASDEAREMTASPAESLKEIFTGIVSEVRSSIPAASFSGENGRETEASAVAPQQAVATSSAFDMSGVVIIDLATSTIHKDDQ